MKNSLNNELAEAIERVATAAFEALSKCNAPTRRSGTGAPAGDTRDKVTDEKGFEDTLLKQEGALDRRATLLGPESENRYVKGPLAHDAKGRFRRGDAKG
jgi:hypothetical protein